jgi:hypothetical protein
LLSGGKIARFTPPANFYGLGSFQFKVTDAQLTSLTNTIGIHVRALAASQLAFSTVNSTPRLSFTGESGFYYLLQYSDDLKNWNTWTNKIATGSPMILTPPGFPNPSARFYRAVPVE